MIKIPRTLQELEQIKAGEHYGTCSNYNSPSPTLIISKAVVNMSWFVKDLYSTNEFVDIDNYKKSIYGFRIKETH